MQWGLRNRPPTMGYASDTVPSHETEDPSCSTAHWFGELGLQATGENSDELTSAMVDFLINWDARRQFLSCHLRMGRS